MLEDVDRIEVIRGPGATLWGANAVDGVINVITKKAKSTQSTIVTAGAGNRGRAGWRAFVTAVSWATIPTTERTQSTSIGGLRIPLRYDRSRRLGCLARRISRGWTRLELTR